VTTRSEVPPVLLREATPVDLAATTDLNATAGLPLAGLDEAVLVPATDPTTGERGGR
jgi:hypothetical protein